MRLRGRSLPITGGGGLAKVVVGFYAGELGFFVFFWLGEVRERAGEVGRAGVGEVGVGAVEAGVEDGDADDGVGVGWHEALGDCGVEVGEGVVGDGGHEFEAAETVQGFSGAVAGGLLDIAVLSD